MPKKNWTDEERKAFGEKMKKAREEKSEPAKETEEILPNEDVQALLKRIEELENKEKYARTEGVTPTVTTKGVLGSVERYPVDPANYSDPSEKLADEPRLRQFAFKNNYTIDYTLSVSSYETKDGINTKEPKFNLQLNRILLDDEGVDTGKRYVVKRAVFHEDPTTALIMAREQGLEVEKMEEVDFLNDMRYLRMKDWLLEIFYPPVVDNRAKIKEEVIGGKLVKVFEVASVEPTKVEFEKLDKKL